MSFFVNAVLLIIEIYTFVIFIRAILSWFSPRPNTLTIILGRITEPVLEPIRNILPRTGGLDLSPLVAIILLQIIHYIIRALS